MKRALLIIVGIVLVMLGLVGVAVGTSVAAVVGTDGSLSADAGRISGSGYALVFNNFAVDTPGDPDTYESIGDLTAGASSLNGQDVFIGVAPTKDVTSYLTDVQRDVVSDIRGSTARVNPIPGTKTPAAPGDQTFWTAKATGSSPSIAVGENESLVIMNANPVAPVSVELHVGFQSGAIFPVAIGLIVFGVIMWAFAVWCFIASRRIKRRKLAVNESQFPPAQAYAPQPLVIQLPPDAPAAPVTVAPVSAPAGESVTVGAPEAPRPDAGGDGPPPAPNGQ